MYNYPDKLKIRLERVKVLFKNGKITNRQAIAYLQSIVQLRGTAEVLFHYHILGWR